MALLLQALAWLPLAVANVHMEHFDHGDHCNIQRVPYDELTPDRFRRQFEGQKPVMLTGSTEGWTAHEHWTLQPLLDAIPETQEGAWGTYRRPKGGYLGYLRRMVAGLFDPQSNHEHSNQIDETAVTEFPELTEHYTAPRQVRNLLPRISAALPSGPDDNHRVRIWRCEQWPWQYHILSPSHSGGPWHIDPPETAFWNTLVSGKKHWVMAPPLPSASQLFRASVGFAEAEQELQADQWFDSSYQQWWAAGNLSCVQRPGDAMYMPIGWAHTALAVQPSIGVSEQIVAPGDIGRYIEYQVRRINRLAAARRRQDDEEKLEFIILPVLCAATLQLEGLEPAMQREVLQHCASHVSDRACQRQHESMHEEIQDKALLQLLARSLEFIKSQIATNAHSDL